MSGGAPARKGGKTRAPTRRGSTSTRRVPKPDPGRTTPAPKGSDQSQAIALLHERLRQRFGTPRPESYQAPLDEVIFTVLSQNTTDTNRDRAWAGLWQRFDSWEEIAGARADKIAAAIKPGGLHRVKAKRIKAILQQIILKNLKNT